MKTILCLCISLLLFNCGQKNSDSSEKSLKTIAVIPQDSSTFWQGLVHGLETGSQKLKWNTLIWSPQKPATSVAKQKQGILEAVKMNATAIFLTPIEAFSLEAQVFNATDAKIPVFFIENNIPRIGTESFLYTSAMSQRGAQLLGKALDGKGLLLTLGDAPGSSMDKEPYQTFSETIKSLFPSIQIKPLRSNGKMSFEEAFSLSEKALILNPQVAGVFCFSSISSRGMLKALRDINKTTEIQFAGIGVEVDLLEALAAEEIQNLIIPDAFQMGLAALDQLKARLDKANFNPSLEIPPLILTPQNVHEPVHQYLWSPLHHNESAVVVGDH